MTLEEAIRVLLEGTCGVSVLHVSRETGLSRGALRGFMAGRRQSQETIDRIGLFVFRRMNAHVLIAEEDRLPIPIVTEADLEAEGREFLGT
jgi:hypothetical protein